MSTARRSGRLSQLSSSQQGDSQMDVDNSSDDEMVESITSPKTRQTRKAPAAASPARKRTSTDGSLNSNSSFSSLFAPLKSGAVISTLIDEWIEEYATSKGKHVSTQALLALVLETALLKDVPSAKVVASGNQEAVKKFVEAIKINESADLPEFPLSGKSPSATKFSRAFLRFWQDLVTAGGESAFADEFLLPTLNMFFAAFVRSRLRPLRFAAATACFTMCTALMSQLESVSYDLKQREKQKRTNESRGGGSKAAAARLDADMAEMQKRAQRYEKAILDIWTHVFSVTWKDRDAAIRTLSVKSLGAWCIKLPRLFMDSDRFRFLTWLMADGQAEVRLAAGEVLYKLLETEPLRHLLENYCTHLVDRVLSFTRDSNEKVAIVGVQIARLLRQHFGRDYLSDEVVREISLLISIESPALRQAAGAFALPDIIANADEHTGDAKDGEEEEPKKGRKKKTTKKDAAKKDTKSLTSQLKGASAARILSLLEFIPDATVHQELPGIVIDAIWKQESDYFLFQFEDIAKLISATDSTQLSDEKLLLLAEVVLAVLQKIEDSATSKAPKGFSPSQLVKSFTQVFYTLLPELLSSHKAEDKILPPIISLVNFLDTSHISSIKTDGTRNAVSQLAQNLKAILGSTTNETVMSKVVSAFDHLLADTTFKYHRDVDRILRLMVDEMTESLRGFVDQFDAPGSSQVARPKRRESNTNSASFVDGAAPGSAPLVLCLTRLFSLTRYFDLNRLDDTIVDLALKVMETRVDGLVTVVGPRSAHFASQLAARLLCYRMNEFATEQPTEGNKDAEDQYDVVPGQDDEKNGDDSEDEEMLESQATGRSRRSQRNKGATMDDESENGDDVNATPNKKKAKKGKSTGQKIYGSVALPHVPTGPEMTQLAKKIQDAARLLQELLSRTMDDSDLDDLASYGAFLSLGHLLSTYCPSLSATALKPLAYQCSAELEEAISTAFEAEMERVAQEDDELDVETRALLVLNFYYRLLTIGVFGTGGLERCAMRCVAQLKSPHSFVAKSARQMLNELRASAFQTPAQYASLITETLKYAYSLAPVSEKTDREEAQLRHEVTSLAKHLTKSFPPGNTSFGADSCKLVLDSLVRHGLGSFSEDWELLAWSCAPFVSKLTPAAARQLIDSWSLNVDHLAEGVDTDMKETYAELKNLISNRASGRRSNKAAIDDADLDGSLNESTTKRTPKKTTSAKSTPKRASTAASTKMDESEDGDMEFNTPAKRTPKRTPKKTSVSEAPSRRSSRATSTAIIHQDTSAAADAVSVTEDSEMAHTDDEGDGESKTTNGRSRRASALTSTAKMTMDDDESEEMALTPATSRSVRGGASRRSSQKETSSGQVGDSEDEDEQIGLSQASIEINLDDLLEPPSTRQKRGRAAGGRSSLSSQASAPSADDAEDDAHSSDSDSIMKHTPVAKKRASRK